MLDLIKFLIENIFVIFLILYFSLLFTKCLKKIQIALLIFIILISITPFPYLLVYSVERLFIPGDIINIEKDFDKIVILSGNEDVEKTKKFNQLYLGGTNNRIIEGVRLYNFYKKKIIFSGSSLYNSNERDVYAAKIFFKDFNVNDNFLIIDDKAVNTEDTFAFLNLNFKNEKHLIVTSAMHILRCKLLAEQFKLNYILYPVDYKVEKKDLMKINLDIGKNINLFHYGIREISALLLYKLSNKI